MSRCGLEIIAMAPDDATDISVGFKQFVIAVDTATNPLTMDDISIMCSNLCYVTY